MDEYLNKEYLTELLLVAEQELQKECDFSVLGFNQFELINSFLIHKSISKDRNLHIRTYNKSENESFYIPAIISVAIFGFARNYIDYDPKPIVGEILQKDRKRYRVSRIHGDRVTITNRADSNLLSDISIKSYRKYIVTTADKETTDRKLSSGFEHYRCFFNKLFNIGDYLPSKFANKYLIITCKEILNAVKKVKLQDVDVYKSIPIQYVTSGGVRNDNLPIDPMLYIVNDYETAKEFILREQKIDTIIIVGDNKYRECSRSVAQDIRASRISNVIYIGSESVDNFENLPIWKWTKPEQEILSQCKYNIADVQVVEKSCVSDRIKEFEQIIDGIETRYNISIFDELKGHINQISKIVIPNYGSRLNNLLLILKESFKALVADVIERSFFDKGIYDCDKTKEEVVLAFNAVVDAIKFDKWHQFANIKKVHYLVVPKTHVEDLTLAVASKRLKTKVITYSDIGSIKGENPIVCFFSIYGMSHFNECYQSEKFKPLFILYPHEVEYYNSLESRYSNSIAKEITSEDRYNLSGVEYVAPSYSEDVDGMIKRLFDKSDKRLKIGSREISDEDYHIKAKIEFDDGDYEVVDISKSVLLCGKSQSNIVLVDKLQAGDTVRIYSNTNKEQLWDLATQSDTNGVFQEINKASVLWKRLLYSYKNDNLLSLEELFNKLKNNGLTAVKQYRSIERWIDVDGDTKFPATSKSLAVIKRTINDREFDEAYQYILKMKRSYRGIMISLGRDLSDEIIAYIQSGGSNIGDIMNKFEPAVRESFAQQNAPIRKITTITYLQDGEDE